MRGSNEMTHPRTEELAWHPSTRTFAPIVGRFFCASCAATKDACPARLFPSKPCKIRDPDLMRNLIPATQNSKPGIKELLLLPPVKRAHFATIRSSGTLTSSTPRKEKRSFTRYVGG